MKISRSALIILTFASSVCAFAQQPIPDDFPHFIVPGHEKEMETMRQMFWLHYQPAGPMATLWDEWLSGATLWPAIATDNRMNTIRERWAETLSNRHIDSEGYVATHQHASIAHQDGWPFPAWPQGGSSAWGWHFAVPGPIYAWGKGEAKSQKGWELSGGADRGIDKEGWNVELTSPSARIATPRIEFQADNSPFIQMRWRASGMDRAQPFIQWMGEGDTEFSEESRYYFEPVREPDGMYFTMIPVYRSPKWRGKITRLALNFDNPAGAKITIQAVFTQYDTRHNINAQNFIRGCCQYFWWTRDLNFLRHNIQRMRLAQLYMLDVLGGRKERLILTPWAGHDGRSGIEITQEKKKIIHPGQGIGNNYWDLLPMGYKDAYATIHYWDMLNYMIKLEREIEEHPEWNIPEGPTRIPWKDLKRHAQAVKDYAGQFFWNQGTKRFVCAVDSEGIMHDYGFTFINLEAIVYGFATPEQSEAIMQWIEGERTIEGDTSKGEDIYHWRFGPRATTKRNEDYYFWGWSNPESIPFGGQVQDGGAVFGFSAHDLVSRLVVRGPDDAWKRLRDTIQWFDEVQAAGGYRAYYKDGTRGTLQGGGTAGGLGLDQEFFESILVPQVLIGGFLGFRPCGDGFGLNPRLPADWPSITIDRIHFHRHIMKITAAKDSVAIEGDAPGEEVIRFYPPQGKWKMSYTGADGRPRDESDIEIARYDDYVPVEIRKGMTLRLDALK